jgi:hypothetical protein
VDNSPPRWSGDVHEADWIASRLAPRGTIEARLRRPGVLRAGELRIEAVTLYVTLAVLGLAGR